MNLCNLESLSTFLSIGKWLLEIMLSQGTLFIDSTTIITLADFTHASKIKFLIITVNAEFVPTDFTKTLISLWLISLTVPVYNHSLCSARNTWKLPQFCPNKTNLKIYRQEPAIYFYFTRNSFNSVI